MREPSEAPHADDVAVGAFVEGTLGNLETDGTFEGGHCKVIVMSCVNTWAFRLHHSLFLQLLRVLPHTDKE